MKAVQFTLTITGLVPDDIDIDALFLDLNLQKVRVGHFDSCDEPQDIEVRLEEYETVNVEALDGGDPEWCQDNNCEHPKCHRCFPDPQCGLHGKCIGEKGIGEMPLDADHDLPEDDLPRDTIPYSDEGP